MNGAADIQVHDEALELLPERVVFWRRRRMLIAADTHFGKTAVFGRHGVAVPAGTDAADLAQLASLAVRLEAREVVVLGDFVHAPLTAASFEARALVDWVAALEPTQLTVVAGNHDRGTLARWRPPCQWHEDEWVQGPFRFMHDADRGARRDRVGFTLSGHVHPVVRLGGLRRVRPRVPVFWLRPHGLVLPAFGSFTGGYAVRPGPEDRLFAVTADRVIRLGSGA